MASSFEKSVKGATKYKATPPKLKYIEHILIATHSGDSGVAEIFRSLQHRLRDSTWTIVFKSLITIHLMIREGSPDVTLAYLARNRNMLAISNFSDVQTHGRDIRRYTNYLSDRALGFRETKCDFVRGAKSRLEKLTVEKGLLRETESVQHQISALLKCDVLEYEPENEITITVFRMLVLDLLSLFHTMNTGLINILGHFFEMSKIDAERALKIYKNFTEQTDLVVQYLSVARQYEHQTRVEVPKLKHAPVNLGKQLEDYLRDPDFEANRMQYLREQETKNNRNKKSKKILSRNEFQPRPHTAGQASTKLTSNKISPSVKGPDPDLIDFFESIEQNQQPLTTQLEPKLNAFESKNTAHFPINEHQLYQQNGFMPQNVIFQNQNHFPQVFNSISGQQSSQNSPPNFSLHETSGYSLQIPFQSNGLSPIAQTLLATDYPSPVSQQYTASSIAGTIQTTNPFRQSMKITSSQVSPGLLNTSTSMNSPSTIRLSTNPFAISSNTPNYPFSPPLDQNSQQIQQLPAAPSISPVASGTNPFAKPIATTAINMGQRSQVIGEQTEPFGGTNPFRQTPFPSNLVRSDWQNEQKPIGGSLDDLETIPVFPRPMQQQAWPY